MEIKIPTGSVKKEQVLFLATYPGFAGLAWDNESAESLAFFPEIRELTQSQRNLLIDIGMRMGKQIKMSVLLKELQI